jgi:hypothetical protein
MRQLIEEAFEFVSGLVDVLDDEDATTDARKIGCAQ